MGIGDPVAIVSLSRLTGKGKKWTGKIGCVGPELGLIGKSEIHSSGKYHIP